METDDTHDQKYGTHESYWGTKPSAICDRVMELVGPRADFHPKLIDLGSGEGRNAIYFAKNGFDVAALDTSLVGLQKMEKWAQEINVKIESIKANIIDHKLKSTYDVVFSTGTLHYLPPEIRRKCFQNYKDCTSLGGINALSVFVKKPFIARAPDAEETAHNYKSGELMGYYWDWEIVFCIEEIFDCMSSGIPHKHVVDRIIAKKNSSKLG